MRERWLVLASAACLAACAADNDDGTGNADNDDDSVLDRDAGSVRDGGTDAGARDAMPAVDANKSDTGQGVRSDGGRDAATDSDAAVNMNGPNPEPGRLAGITAVHNRVRDAVNATTPLAALIWSPEIAQVAQAYADKLAAGCSGTSLEHSMDRRYGENLALYGTSGAANQSAPQQVVDGWAGEAACWTYGTVSGTELCDLTCTRGMNSIGGCGHYTQIIWRKTQQIGCGVADCSAGGSTRSYWVCNYSPPGNVVGQTPY